MAELMADRRAAFLARLAGSFYLLTFVTGMFALASRSNLKAAAEVVSAVCYIAVALLFYQLFKPVNGAVSLVTAIIGVIGCAVSILNRFGAVPFKVNALAFFGCYCLLIGYLITHSTFLPRFVGILMAIGGVGWLTFASAALSRRLVPYNFIPGIIGEGVLTLWLLIAGVKQSAKMATRASA